MAKNSQPKLRFNLKGYAFVEIDKRRHYLGYKRGDRRADVAHERLLLIHGYAADEPVRRSSSPHLMQRSRTNSVSASR